MYSGLMIVASSLHAEIYCSTIKLFSHCSHLVSISTAISSSVTVLVVLVLNPYQYRMDDAFFTQRSSIYKSEEKWASAQTRHWLGLLLVFEARSLTRRRE
jgi:hypothetical protein